MPAPPQVKAEARRLLARLTLPPELRQRFLPRSSEPAAPGREPSAPPGASRAISAAGDASAPFHLKKDYASAVLRRDPFARRGLLPRSESAAPGATDDASSAPSQNKYDVNSHSSRQPVFQQIGRVGSRPPFSNRQQFPSKKGVIKEKKKEEKWFSSRSEKPVYQDYLKCIDRVKFEEDLPEGVLTVPLLKHQRIGLSFMRYRERSTHCAGGFLADEQGIGKKISLIALIQKEMPQQSKFKSSSETAGGTLVVCPKKVVLQWKEEFASKVTESAKLPVLVYYDYRDSRTPDPEELVQADVVLTTYDTLKQQLDTIADVKWFRVALDEAHTIRNIETRNASDCCELEAERRWCLSGTPFQKTHEELYSYLCFLRFEPYCEKKSFDYLFREGKKKRDIVLSTILLQRKKDTIIDGEPIVTLPEKTIEMKGICFTTEERDLYSSLGGERRRQCLNGQSKSSFKEMNSVLMERLKACNHHCLISQATKRSERKSDPERSYVSSKIKAVMDILNSLVSESENAPEKALVFCYFHEMLDLLELQLKNANIQFRRIDGSTLLDSGEKVVEDFNTKPEVRVLLLSLKSGSLGLNLAAASRVILVQPWWNPYVEKQAIDRAHGITQSRPVTVHRLFIKDTVEERILFLQERKEEIIKDAFGGDIFADPASLKKLNKLGNEDLKYLLDEDPQSSCPTTTSK